MILNRLKKIQHLVPVRKHVMGEDRPTPTQVNAEAYSGKFTRRRRDWKRGSERQVKNSYGFRCSWK